jgi:putative FmdB family regulatory protein
MATYGYRCARHGPFEVHRPIGTAPATVSCPSCGGRSTRVFTPPMLGIADRNRVAVIDRAEASRSEPAVVSAPPPARRASGGHLAPAPRLDPRTRRLPRP